MLCPGLRITAYLLVNLSLCHLVTFSPFHLVTFSTLSPCKPCEPCWNVCLIVLLCCLAWGCSQVKSNKCSIQVWGWLHISFTTLSPCQPCKPCWNVCLIALLCCLALGCSQGVSNKCSVQVWGWLHISLSGLSIARPRRSGSAQTKDLDWIFSVANPTDSELTSQTDRSGIHLIYGGAQAPAKKYAKIR